MILLLLFQGFVFTAQAQAPSAAITPAPAAPTQTVTAPGRLRALELSCVHIDPIASKYLDRHVTHQTLNGNLETRTVEQLVKRLDGSKLYLIEGDVTEIKKNMTGIFGKVKSKDCSALDKTHQLYVKRVKERVEFAKKYLGPKFVFNPKVEITLKVDERKRPKTVAEANRAHQNYLQYQVASYLASDMKLEEAKQQIVRNYERALRRVQDNKKEDLFSSFLDAYASGLDPHSSYLSADNLEDFEIQMRLNLQGIGATLSSQDGFTVIEQLVPGGPADRSGKLKVKDRIVAVAQGQENTFQNVIEMEIKDVVRLIRGPKGSEVKLKILRKNGKESDRFELALTRDQIKLEDDRASIQYFDKEVNGQKKKIALLNLPSFYSDNKKNGYTSSADVKNLLADAVKNNADAVVLDVSSNAGGSLKDAVDISGLFIATGNVVKQSERADEGGTTYNYETLADTDPAVNWSGPLVILTNRMSASASEIVSGTLQDYKRAVIVGGDHTFGKGTVQSVEYLPPGLGAMKTTVGMFFTPGGNSTQHRGVLADIAIPSIYNAEELGEKSLDYSLPPKKIPEFISKTAEPAEGKGVWKEIDTKIIEKLKKASQERVKTSAEFKKVAEDIDKAKKRSQKIIVGDLIKDKNSKDPKKKDGEEGDESTVLSREERKKKYLERPDVKEAINIAADLVADLGGVAIQIGSTKKDSEPRN